MTQVGTTNLVRLTYVGDKADLTERGARSAATQALQVYRGRQLTAAESARDALQAQYDEATAAVNAFVASSGSTSPPADYQARANTLARLDAEIALARAGGSRASLDSLTAARTAAAAEVERLGALLGDYQALAGAQDRISRQLSSAQGAVRRRGATRRARVTSR